MSRHRALHSGPGPARLWAIKSADGAAAVAPHQGAATSIRGHACTSLRAKLRCVFGAQGVWSLDAAVPFAAQSPTVVGRSVSLSFLRLT